jgi:FtsP/CotA-like multicopper oxidase with cupredoxin domain
MPTVNRRAVLGAGLGAVGAGLLSACTHAAADLTATTAERRPRPGPAGHHRLTATETTLDLGGRTVRSWAYGDRAPGRELRVTAGETLAVTLANQLPEPTTVHWHGVALRNDMDGVPEVTQRAVQPGETYDYRFTVPHPGTYWLHPHVGVQQDRGLYAPLIVDDPKEPLGYDREWVVVLDDWLDGVDGRTPEAELEKLSGGMGPMHHGVPHGGSDLLGGDAGDVSYPFHLVNGRTADDPETFHAKPGERIRLRIINAGGDTAFRVALGGHRMTVTHTDGFPVEHATTDALLLGMGERYDALVTARDGAFPLTALAEGKGASGMAVLRTGGGRPPQPSARPAELDGKLVRAGQLTADASVRLPPRRPDRTIELRLTGSMMAYDWSINGEPYEPEPRYRMQSGERVRLRYVNDTDMWHPMHLHGHTFALPGDGPRKDTAIVLPGRTLEADFDADNPGRWLTHCHNVYHGASGMMTVLGYRE